MKSRDLLELLALAAIWGASFLFMRMAAPAFGPLALAGTRVVGASLFLLPLLWWRGEIGALRAHWRPILVVGITNSALPFLCFGYAALAITGGLSAIFNATTPLWGALIAWLWLGDRPNAWRLSGLAVGFGGVLWLAGDRADFRPDATGISAGLAVLACLVATLMYGFSASYTKRYLGGVPAMALACGSQLAAALLLAPLAILAWPGTSPEQADWLAAAALSWLCTGVAYVLYFRLIGRIGAPNTITVTFLIPAFAVIWGALFLHEPVDAHMLLACGVILSGTALVVGLAERLLAR